ncbi:chaplin [Streptomyces beijiangensis]|uniref:Chaplin n=1 Tax=Streptomyces beijiangensis TaxID=163361 RepID=A0A939JDR5_9ACTN|nr:chaplin [Streptomyces beijiangensis]MBO0512296.1 chaplin [Streptomyces beijiangensis]
MRQVTKKGLITMAAASGVLAMSGGYAHADSTANGNASNSPGVLSGNSVEVPVHIPVNACGNTANVVGLLNPAAGNSCSNTSAASAKGGGSTARGTTGNSPGVGSGNKIQVPVDVPVNACGNSVTIGGLGNAAQGNDCSNGSRAVPPPGVDNPPNPGTPGTPQHPGTPGTPSTRAIPPNAPVAQTITMPKATEQLAETGAGSIELAVPAAAGLLLAGAVLYRRARSAA